MACAEQSAVEYLEKARTRLVTHLQNFPLITENLYQCKVLNEHEADAIKAEKRDFDKARFILDSVIKKGEAASYELLKILDITRKRTLHPDSHYWISCFSFREEPETEYSAGSQPCHYYQKQLKQKAEKIFSNQIQLSKCYLRGKKEGPFFIPLELDTNTDLNTAESKMKTKQRKCKKIRPKKLRAYIPQVEKMLSPNDLLKSFKQKVLLIGKPGIGKTATVKQMLHLWAERDDRALDYMFYFDEKDLSCISDPTKNLEHLLFDIYSKPLEKHKQEVLQDIEENSENVTIIFDGVTDVPPSSILRKIIDKDILPDAKIVITCQPETDTEDSLPEDWCRVYVQGFNEKSIQAYFTQVLGSQPDLVSSVVNNLELFSLCHVPMYASMVAACISYCSPKTTKKSCTVSEMYINIFRLCIQKQTGINLEDLDEHIEASRDTIIHLATKAFSAACERNVNLEFKCKKASVQSVFLKSLNIELGISVVQKCCTFLHNTMQEFFAALWLLENPGDIDMVLQHCQTEEKKHMRYVIPFLCGLLSGQNTHLLRCLFPEEQIKEICVGFFEKVLDTFLNPVSDRQPDILFVCQCLYEYRSREACLLFMEKVDYYLDLSEQHIDPHQSCVLSYVISQSGEKKVGLNLEDCTLSDWGLKIILKCCQNLRNVPSTFCQLWTTILGEKEDRDFTTFLSMCENEMHLPVRAETSVFRQVGKVMRQSLEKVNLYLHWDGVTRQLSDTLCNVIVSALPYIRSVKFTPPHNQRELSAEWKKRVRSFILDLCLQAALCQRETLQTALNTLLSYVVYEKCDFLLDLYSHVKDYETQTGRSVLPVLQPVYQSAPAVWYIDLSERKASLFLEVLKLQTVKKPVELRGWLDEESEVRSFLQCLPYISHISFTPPHYQRESYGEWEKRVRSFRLDLCLQAALCQRETLHTAINTLLSYVEYQRCDFLLDLYSHVKDYETQTGRSVLPVLQPVYQSAPAVWYIDLSERKASLLLEVLKLQTVKKPVVLRGWSDEESEVRSFLQCLPYMSQLRFDFDRMTESAVTFLLNLSVAAVEWDTATGETFSKLLSFTCSYSLFPFPDDLYYTDYDYYIIYSQCDFLLYLYSQVKDYETQTGRSVLPVLQSVYQSAPAVWCIDLSDRKASLFLEVLKLQTVKKPVELRGWSDEESEVKSFLQCLPYILTLKVLSEAEQCVVSLCKVVRTREEIQQVASLLQALDFTLTLGGRLPNHTCRAVGRALGPSASRLNLTLNPQSISLRGVRRLFRNITHLRTLSLSGRMAVRMVRALRSVRGHAPVTIEELSLVLTQLSEGELSGVLSSLASLLRVWTVQCLDLIECDINSHSLIGLLCHQGPLAMRLSRRNLYQLITLVYDAQEVELTRSFLEKVGGDLTSCSLTWEMLCCLLQDQTQHVTVNFKKIDILHQNIRQLLPLLDRVQFKGLSSSFLMSIIREIYETRSAHCVSGLLRSVENYINLNTTVLDSVDCAALCFTLQHSKGVRLNLLWTSIPEGAIENILPFLNTISQLSVDRLLLLRLLHCCCMDSELQQGAAVALLRALQHTLDFSCCSAVDLSTESEGETLHLSPEHCRLISTATQSSHTHTHLILHDCDVQDAGLNELFPALHRTLLSCSKDLLLQFLTLVYVGTERGSVKRAVALSQALGDEVDFSGTRLDLQACRSLALVLEHSDGLSELDLSHCQLTDHCLELLLPHLHIAQVLDLSHNEITDCVSEGICSMVSTNNSVQTVRLFNNRIRDRTPFLIDRRFEICLSHNEITDCVSEGICSMVSTNNSVQTVRLFNNRIRDRTPFLIDRRFEIW